MRDLPMHTLGMIKSELFRAGLDVGADQRVALMSRMRTAPAYITARFHCPSLFAVADLPASAEGDEAAAAAVPASLPLSEEQLASNAAYLLDNGLKLYLWLGRDVDDALLGELFGEAVRAPLAEVDASKLVLEPRETPLSDKLYALIDALMDQNEFPQDVIVVRQSDAAAVARFNTFLIEDRTQAAQSYNEFLGTLQRQINAK